MAEEGGFLTGVLTTLAGHRVYVLPVVAAITFGSILLATRLEATFEVKDFFASNSDFVVGLDKLDEHVSDRGGEPATVYVEGDLADPDALASIEGFVARLAENPFVGREADGEANVDDNVLTILSRLTESEYARAQIEATTGTKITDGDGDGLPDSREQLQAAYEFATTKGVPFDRQTNVFTPGEVRTVLSYDGEKPSGSVAIFSLGIPGTREQSAVTSARQALTNDLSVLEESPAIVRVGLTGSPFEREQTLDATTKTLQTSLPIAALGAFLLLLVTMRSFRYAVVTVIPIGLVAAWLYRSCRRRASP